MSEFYVWFLHILKSASRKSIFLHNIEIVFNNFILALYFLLFHLHLIIALIFLLLAF